MEITQFDPKTAGYKPKDMENFLNKFLVSNRKKYLNINLKNQNYINENEKNTLFRTRLNWNYFYDLLSFKQRIKYYGKMTPSNSHDEKHYKTTSIQ